MSESESSDFSDVTDLADFEEIRTSNITESKYRKFHNSVFPDNISMKEESEDEEDIKPDLKELDLLIAQQKDLKQNTSADIFQPDLVIKKEECLSEADAVIKQERLSPELEQFCQPDIIIKKEGCAPEQVDLFQPGLIIKQESSSSQFEEVNDIKRYAVLQSVLEKRAGLPFQLPQKSIRILIPNDTNEDKNEIPEIQSTQKYLSTKKQINLSIRNQGANKNNKSLIGPNTRSGKKPIPFKRLAKEAIKKIFDNDYIKSIDTVRELAKDRNIIEILMELISVQNNDRNDIIETNLSDTWEFLAKHISVNKYLLFLKTMVHLVIYPEKETERRLAVLTAHSYFLLLGSQAVSNPKVFNVPLLIDCMLPFKLLDSVRDLSLRKLIEPDVFNRTQVHLLCYMNDIARNIKYIPMCQHPQVISSIIKAMIAILRHNYCIGYESIYVWEFTKSAIEILGVICMIGKEEFSTTPLSYSMPNPKEERKTPLGIRMVFHEIFPLIKNNKFIRVFPNVLVSYSDRKHFVADFFRDIIPKNPKPAIYSLASVLEGVCGRSGAEIPEKPFIDDIREILKIDEFIFSKYNETLLYFLDLKYSFGTMEERINTLKIIRIFVKLQLQTPDFVLNKRIAPREYIVIKLVLRLMRDPNTKVHAFALQIFLEIFHSENVILRRITKDIFFTKYKNILDRETFDKRCKIYEMLSSAASMRMPPPPEPFVYADHDDIEDEVKGPEVKTLILKTSKVYPVDKKFFSSPKDFKLFNSYCKNLMRTLFKLYRASDEVIKDKVMEVFQTLCVMNRKLFEQYEFLKFIYSLRMDDNLSIRKAGFKFIVDITNKLIYYEPALYLFIKIGFLYIEDPDVELAQFATKTIQQILLINIKPYGTTCKNSKRQWRILHIMLLSPDKDHYINKLKILMEDVTWPDDTYSALFPYLFTKHVLEAWIFLLFLQDYLPRISSTFILLAMNFVFLNIEKYPVMDYSILLEILCGLVPKLNKHSLFTLRAMLTDIMVTDSALSGQSSQMYEIAVLMTQQIQYKYPRLTNDDWASKIKVHVMGILMAKRSDFLYGGKLDVIYKSAFLLYTQLMSDHEYNTISDQAMRQDIINVIFKFAKNDFVDEHYAHIYNNNSGTNDIELLLHTDNAEKLTFAIVIATRISMVSKRFAKKLLPMYVKLAIKFKHYLTVINNLAFGFHDLFIKYGEEFGLALASLINMLTSEYASIRMHALLFLMEFIAEKKTILHGDILLHVIIGISDKDSGISDVSKKIIIQHIFNEENLNICQKIFLDTILILNHHQNYTNFTYFTTMERSDYFSRYNLSTCSKARMKVYKFLIECSNIEDLQEMALTTKEMLKAMSALKLINRNKAKRILTDFIFCLRKILIVLSIQGKQTILANRPSQGLEDEDDDEYQHKDNNEDKDKHNDEDSDSEDNTNSNAIHNHMCLATASISPCILELINSVSVEYPTLLFETKKLGIIFYLGLFEYIELSEKLWRPFVRDNSLIIKEYSDKRRPPHLKFTHKDQRKFLEKFLFKNLSPREENLYSP